MTTFFDYSTEIRGLIILQIDSPTTLARGIWQRHKAKTSAERKLASSCLCSSSVMVQTYKGDVLISPGKALEAKAGSPSPLQGAWTTNPAALAPGGGNRTLGRPRLPAPGHYPIRTALKRRGDRRSPAPARAGALHRPRWLKRRGDRRSPAPVRTALKRMGDRWSPAPVRTALKRSPSARR